MAMNGRRSDVPLGNMRRLVGWGGEQWFQTKQVHYRAVK